MDVMEILLILQPVSGSILPLAVVLGALSLIALVATHVTDGTCDSDNEEKQRGRLHRIAKPLAIVCLVVFFLFLPPSYAWDIYKNVLAYRAINSETADKAIGNANLFMDKLTEFMGEWKPEKVIEAAKKSE